MTKRALCEKSVRHRGARREVYQRAVAWAIADAFKAVAFAQEESEAVFLSFGQLGLVVEVGVELGAEGIHLLRPLVGEPAPVLCSWL
jgi:hypothetical protein